MAGGLAPRPHVGEEALVVLGDDLEDRPTLQGPECFDDLVGDPVRLPRPPNIDHRPLFTAIPPHATGPTTGTDSNRVLSNRSPGAQPGPKGPCIAGTLGCSSTTRRFGRAGR